MHSELSRWDLLRTNIPLYINKDVVWVWTKRHQFHHKESVDKHTWANEWKEYHYALRLIKMESFPNKYSPFIPNKGEMWVRSKRPQFHHKESADRNTWPMRKVNTIMHSVFSRWYLLPIPFITNNDGSVSTIKETPQFHPNQQTKYLGLWVIWNMSSPKTLHAFMWLMSLQVTHMHPFHS